MGSVAAPRSAFGPLSRHAFDDASTFCIWTVASVLQRLFTASLLHPGLSRDTLHDRYTPSIPRNPQSSRDGVDNARGSDRRDSAGCSENFGCDRSRPLKGVVSDFPMVGTMTLILIMALVPF